MHFDHGSPKDENGKDERDWTQIFVEDVAEPHFKAQLPKLCKLLLSKDFPTSPFSDTESDTTPTRNTSPVPTVALRSPTTTHVPSQNSFISNFVDIFRSCTLTRPLTHKVVRRMTWL